MDVSAPIPWRLRIGWEELLGEPIDLSHYYFDAEEPEAVVAPTVAPTVVVPEELEIPDEHLLEASQRYEEQAAMSNNPVVEVVGENEDPEIMSLLALTAV